MISYLCYVTYDDIPEYQKRGWIVVSGLYGNHGHYAVLMEATKEAWLHIMRRRVWSHLQVVDGEVGTPSADAERKERIRSHRSARMAALHREGEPT